MAKLDVLEQAGEFDYLGRRNIYKGIKERVPTVQRQTTTMERMIRSTASAIGWLFGRKAQDKKVLPDDEIIEAEFDVAADHPEKIRTLNAPRSGDVEVAPEEDDSDIHELAWEDIVGPEARRLPVSDPSPRLPGTTDFAPCKVRTPRQMNDMIAALMQHVREHGAERKKAGRTFVIRSMNAEQIGWIEPQGLQDLLALCNRHAGTGLVRFQDPVTLDRLRTRARELDIPTEAEPKRRSTVQDDMRRLRDALAQSEGAASKRVKPVRFSKAYVESLDLDEARELWELITVEGFGRFEFEDKQMAELLRQKAEEGRQLFLDRNIAVQRPVRALAQRVQRAEDLE
jgi:hypothetical protein